MKNMISVISLLLSVILFFGCGAAGEIPATTGKTVENQQIPDPEEDDVMNILMVGNSFSFYFCDELYGMLKAAGIKACVYNLYYSGCKLEQHWNWWKSRTANYDMIIHDDSGKSKVAGVDLEYALMQQNWDVITLQEGSAKMRRGDPATELAISSPYRQDLYGLFAQQHPKAKLYWHHTWAYEAGCVKDDYVVDVTEQKAYHERQRTYAIGVCKDNGVTRIPSGDAWQIVREGGYDKLCARLGKGNNHEGDGSHDGDLGGGQFLNASVWFETLTGLSCLENTYRPDYTYNGEQFPLSEDFVAILQKAAHKAVEDSK